MHGFSSLLLGIECKHSLLSRAASVALFQASQALKQLFLYNLPTNNDTKKTDWLTNLFFLCHYFDNSNILTIGRLASSRKASSSSTVGHSYLRVLYNFSSVFRRM